MTLIAEALDLAHAILSDLVGRLNESDQEDLSEDLGRLNEIADTIRLMDELWRAEGPLDFRGDRFHTEGAICRPKPRSRSSISNPPTASSLPAT